jgi:hypothetical protein
MQDGGGADRTAPTKDRFLYWPLVLTLAGPAAYVLALNGPFVFIMFSVPYVVVALWLSAALVATILCGAWVRDRAWRRLISTLILPTTVVVATLNFDVSMHLGAWASDYALFAVRYPSLLADIEKLPRNEPRFIVWGWRPIWTREMGMVYDESDEIASDHPSEAWKKKAIADGVEGSGYRPLYGHFYLVDLQ